MGEIGDALARIGKKRQCSICGIGEEFGGSGVCFECQKRRYDARKPRTISGGQITYIPEGIYYDVDSRRSYTGRYVSRCY